MMRLTLFRGKSKTNNYLSSFFRIFTENSRAFVVASMVVAMTLAVEISLCVDSVDSEDYT